MLLYRNNPAQIDIVIIENDSADEREGLANGEEDEPDIDYVSDTEDERSDFSDEW